VNSGHVHDFVQRHYPGRPDQLFPFWDCGCGATVSTTEAAALANKAKVGVPVPESDILATRVGKFVVVAFSGSREDPERCELLAVDKHGVALRMISGVSQKDIRFYRFDSIGFIGWTD
jgi:hypothetical protein